ACEPDFARERLPLSDLVVVRDLLVLPLRDLLVRERLLLEPLLDELRDRELLERRELLARAPLLRRSAAGISSVTTAFVSTGICFSRKLAMRSSSRRIARASFAVSLSLTASASVSIAVYVAISSCSFQFSVFAF